MEYQTISSPTITIQWSKDQSAIIMTVTPYTRIY